MQGDITAIIDLDENKIVCYYNYDAWGNYSIEGNEDLGELNPFRYRGYYYDTETNLYYLQTRYYDPEIGRFISQDSVEYLDPEHINGLNLYAYCGNNPVMFADPEGTTKWWEWLVTVIIVAVTVVAVVAISVATAGIGTAVAGALGGGMLGGIVGGAVGGAVTGAITGAIIGAGFSVVSQGLSNGYENISWGDVGLSALEGGISGAISGAIFGAISGAAKVASAAKAWHTGGSGSSYKNMMTHFTEHGKGMGFKTASQYTKSAKNVIKNGVYISEKNAYATLAKAGKYNYVGVVRGGTKITTYSFRTFTKTTAALLGL